MSPAAALRYARGRVTSPSSILIASNVLVNVLRIGSTMLLTRLLAPRDFGLTGIIFSVFFIVAMVTDVGFQAFVIRHERGEEPDFLDAIWTIHALRGLLLFLGTAICAGPIGMLVGKPEVTPLLAVASVTLLIDGLISPAMFVALRTGHVQRLSIIDLALAFAQMSAAVVAAFFLRSAWAIVFSLIFGSTARVIASYTVLPDAVRRIRIDRPLASELWRFSRVIAASSILTMMISQVDKLVLARVMILPEFGVYTIAANISQVPVAIALLYVGRIFYPAVANNWRADPAGIGKVIYALRGPVFQAYLFAAGGLIGAAPVAIRILYDPRYAGAALYLGILAIASAMTMLTRSMGEALVAMGEVQMTLVMNIARIVWLIIFGTIGFFTAGPLGLVLALGLIEVPAYLSGVVMMRRLHLLDPLRELWALLLILAGMGTGWLFTLAVNVVFPR